MEVDRSLLALVLAGWQSKWSAVVVDLFLDEEGNSVHSGSVSTSSWNSSAGGGGGSSCLSDSHARDDSCRACDGGACDDGWNRDKLSNGVDHGRSSHGDSGGLCARTLGDDSGTRNHSGGTTDSQSLAATANEGAWVDDVGANDCGSNIPGSSAIISGSGAGIARGCTRGKCSRESDDRSSCDHSSASGARTIGEDRGTCNYSWSSTDSDSLTAIASQRRRVYQLCNFGDGR